MSANYLTEELIAEYRDAFDTFDKNGDGTISTSELYEVMRALGRRPTQEQVQLMVAQLDLDDSGSVDFQEFLILMAQQGEKEKEERAIFMSFDKDGDGWVDSGELSSVMDALGVRLKPEEIAQMVKEADLDGDGRVNFEEFGKMIASM